MNHENKDILSLFDGMGCAYEALERAGIQFNNYYASEIDKHAMSVAQKNHPKIIQLGDINKISFKQYRGTWMIVGGPPCQGFSFAGKQLNFDDPRSKLFFKFAKAISIIKPKYFLMENTNMKQWCQDVISSYLGVQPIKIDSALVSAQRRVRLYWTNIPFIGMPEDRKIVLKDILENELYDSMLINYSSSGRGKGIVEGRYQKAQKTLALTATGYNKRSSTGIYQINPDKSAGGKQPHMQDRVYHINGKSVSLTAGFASRLKISNGKLNFVRKLTCVECERLQTLPDNYTQCEGVSTAQRYKMLGNGWNIETIVHILRGVHQ